MLLLGRSWIALPLIVAGCAPSQRPVSPEPPPLAAPVAPAPVAPVAPKAVAGTVVTEEAFRITVPGEWRENVEEGQALQRRIHDARPQAGENGARWWEGANAKLMLQWARLPGQRAPARALQAAFLGGLRKSLEPGVVRWDLEETRVTTSVTIEVTDQGSTWRGRASAAVDDQGNLWSISAMCIGASIPAECAAAVDTLSIAVDEARLQPLEGKEPL